MYPDTVTAKTCLKTPLNAFCFDCIANKAVNRERAADSTTKLYIVSITHIAQNIRIGSAKTIFNYQCAESLPPGSNRRICNHTQAEKPYIYRAIKIFCISCRRKLKNNVGGLFHCFIIVKIRYKIIN